MNLLKQIPGVLQEWFTTKIYPRKPIRGVSKWSWFRYEAKWFFTWQLPSYLRNRQRDFTHWRKMKVRNFITKHFINKDRYYIQTIENNRDSFLANRVISGYGSCEICHLVNLRKQENCANIRG